MGARKRRAADRAGRPAMRSPGRPLVGRREHRQRFWWAIARGSSSEDAGVAAGVSPAVGSRWFREGGGMPTLSRAPLSGRYLSFAEREEIAILRARDLGVRETARRLGRSASTISRELRRNAATRGGRLEYRATTAQWHADRRGERPKIARLVANQRLGDYVQQRLAGEITRPDGTPVSGPAVRWVGRRHGRRKDRRWAHSWSPEQIANRLRVDFPDDGSMRISHEAIYQALYVQGRGALRRELTACLRTGRVLRVPRARTQGRAKTFLSPEILISERPAEATDRAVPGHWEGDLILGLGQLRGRDPGRAHQPVHHAAGACPHGPTRRPAPSPQRSRAGRPRRCGGPRWDRHLDRDPPRPAAPVADLGQGTEMAQHAQLRIETGLAIYFCDPHSPWQRATNEHTNGLLGQYFPKGTDLSRHTPADLAAVAAALNRRPRKTLGWKTPPRP
jgi:IS30 family transposase